MTEMPIGTILDDDSILRRFLPFSPWSMAALATSATPVPPATMEQPEPLPVQPELAGPQVALAEAGTNATRRLEVVACYIGIQNIARLSEQLHPQELMEQVLLPYSQAVRTEIEARGGYLELYADGDMVALFGYPQPVDNDAERALRAVAKTQQRLRGLQKGWRSRLQLAVLIGTGVARGDMAIGAFEVGGQGRAMLLGEAIRSARRLYSLARGGEVFIAEDVARAGAASNLPMEAVPPVSLPTPRLVQQLYRLIPAYDY
ncbi:MAG: adenylate/guanylate cyclase domain-containing protein [Chloroflexaceae bacterium]|jgi:class 3 adenylate cyclase|nr:adenylate/guanylate cyclase domain-containing protein [Chloroflexaceae bacterium]